MKPVLLTPWPFHYLLVRLTVRDEAARVLALLAPCILSVFLSNASSEDLGGSPQPRLLPGRGSVCDRAG